MGGRVSMNSVATDPSVRVADGDVINLARPLEITLNTRVISAVIPAGAGTMLG
jgi:hypothetical protein